MRRIPAGNDFDGWVCQLAIAHSRQQAKRHLLVSGPPALPALRRGLRHPKAIVRRLCVSILDQLVDEESVPDLVAALDDDDPTVRARALHALACDACKQSDCRPADDLFVPRALEFLGGHPDADLRAAAIDALGKVAQRRPDALAALAAAGESDTNPDLRNMARLRAQRVQAPAGPRRRVGSERQPHVFGGA
jgi:HEAT repeat protein